MWLCSDNYFGFSTIADWAMHLDFEPALPAYYTSWNIGVEGKALWLKWSCTPSKVDAAISGVLADWLDDHRDSLLEGAVGTDPKGRLDLLIRWLREVRCWGKESVGC